MSAIVKIVVKSAAIGDNIKRMTYGRRRKYEIFDCPCQEHKKAMIVQRQTSVGAVLLHSMVKISAPILSGGYHKERFWTKHYSMFSPGRSKNSPDAGYKYDLVESVGPTRWW
jgi:hypothetical protein